MERDIIAAGSVAVALSIIAAFAPPVLPGTEPVLFLEHLMVGAGAVAAYAVADR
jgi:hypothetical protein